MSTHDGSRQGVVEGDHQAAGLIADTRTRSQQSQFIIIIMYILGPHHHDYAKSQLCTGAADVQKVWRAELYPMFLLLEGQIGGR